MGGRKKNISQSLFCSLLRPCHRIVININRIKLNVAKYRLTPIDYVDLNRFTVS